MCIRDRPYTNIPLWDTSMVPVSSAIEDTLRSGGMLNIGSLALGLDVYKRQDPACS